MSEIRQMESISTEIMEPIIEGDGVAYIEKTIEKRAYQCLGCGLVWAIKWHAESCESRRHVPEWSQRYVTGPITNGKPAAERFYPRYALRREPVTSAK